MKKSIYLHIGLHKTGTTSIQVFLTTKKNELEALGVLYPYEGRPTEFEVGQHHLPWSITSKTDYVPDKIWKQNLTDCDVHALWSSLSNEINASNAENIVLSSEEFDMLDLDEINNIGDRLSNFNVTPVLFIRNYADLIESSYRTAVMHSQYPESPEHLFNNSRTRLDYYCMIKDWRTIAYNNHVIVLNYDNDNIRSNTVTSFLTACFPATSEFFEMAKNEPRANESFPAYVVEIVRYLRSKNVNEIVIRKWINQAIGFNNSPRMPTTCISNNLKEMMLSKYSAELESFLIDSELAEIGLECLDFVNQKNKAAYNAISITNEVDALLFMFSGGMVAT